MKNLKWKLFLILHRAVMCLHPAFREDDDDATRWYFIERRVERLGRGDGGAWSCSYRPENDPRRYTDFGDTIREAVDKAMKTCARIEQSL